MPYDGIIAPNGRVHSFSGKLLGTTAISGGGGDDGDTGDPDFPYLPTSVPFAVPNFTPDAITSPWVMGRQKFARGQIPSTYRPVAVDPDGGPNIAVQCDGIKRYSDGSLKSARVAFKVPQTLSARGAAGYSKSGYKFVKELGDPVSGSQAQRDAAEAALIAADHNIKIWLAPFGARTNGALNAAPTYTWSVESIVGNPANRRNANGTYQAANPISGFEMIRKGPVVYAWRVWGYVNKWRRVDCYIYSWGGTTNSPYSIIGPWITSPNTSGAHPNSGITGGSSGAWDDAFFCEAILYRGSTALRHFGGPLDESGNSLIIPASAMDVTTGQFNMAAGTLPNWFSSGFAMTFEPDPATPGSALPAGLNAGQVYFNAIVSGEVAFNQVIKFFPALFRPAATALTASGPLQPLAWTAGARVIYSQSGVTNTTFQELSSWSIYQGTGAAYVTFTKDPTGPGLRPLTGTIKPGPGAGPLSDGRITDWTAVTAPITGAGSGNIRINVEMMTFPNYGNWIGTDPEANMIWDAGTSGIAKNSITFLAIDFDYGMDYSKDIPPFYYDINPPMSDNFRVVRYATTSKDFPRYIPGKEQPWSRQNNSTWDMQNGGVEFWEHRICILPRYSVWSRMSPTDWRVAQLDRTFGFMSLDYLPIMVDETRGLPISYTTAYTGMGGVKTYTLTAWNVANMPTMGPANSKNWGTGYAYRYTTIFDSMHSTNAWFGPYMQTGWEVFADIAVHQANAVQTGWYAADRTATFGGNTYPILIANWYINTGRKPALRQMAWQLRDWMNAEEAVADDAPEYAYLRDQLDIDAAAIKNYYDSVLPAARKTLGWPSITNTGFLANDGGNRVFTSVAGQDTETFVLLTYNYMMQVLAHMAAREREDQRRPQWQYVLDNWYTAPVRLFSTANGGSEYWVGEHGLEITPPGSVHGSDAAVFQTASAWAAALIGTKYSGVTEVGPQAGKTSASGLSSTPTAPSFWDSQSDTMGNTAAIAASATLGVPGAAATYAAIDARIKGIVGPNGIPFVFKDAFTYNTQQVYPIHAMKQRTLPN